MANYPIYRLVKGSTLTFTEMDDNLRWLSANMSASVVTITGSTYVAGNLNVSDGITGSLFGTSSWADNAVSSSYPISITGSNIYSTSPLAGPILNTESTFNSIFLGDSAGYGVISSFQSIFLGAYSGYLASNAPGSNFLGNNAGEEATNANSSNFIGGLAGRFATDAYSSNFIGIQAGWSGSNAYESNFIGQSPGFGAINAYRSNFIGVSAGQFAASASFSTLIGYQVGCVIESNPNLSIGRNNIIIGTNITLARNRADSINIGAIIFGTGSYSNDLTNPFSGSANGRIGINQPNPIFNLDVSGSGRYTNGLTVTGSITGSNALFTGTITAQTLVVQTITASTEWITGSSKFGSLPTDTHQFTGSILAPSITGSLFGTSSWALNTISSSYPIAVTGSTLYSVDPLAGPPKGSSTNRSIFLGKGAGYRSDFADYSVFLGPDAGAYASSASISVFIGSTAGIDAINVASSVFIGQGAGDSAARASYSNFIGEAAGQRATSASYSNFIGYNAGYRAPFASQSILIGKWTGAGSSGTNGIGPNNIIIGNNISFVDDRRDSVNIGAVIFATGSYSGDLVGGLPFKGTSNGKVGINQPNPSANLDVSGSGRFTNGLTVTGSLIAPSITGSLFGTSSWAISASWAPSQAVVTSYIATGSVTASVNTDISASFRVTSGSNTLLNVTREGFVWIGNGSFTNQAYQLDVQGTGRFTGQLTSDSYQLGGGQMTISYASPNVSIRWSNAGWSLLFGNSAGTNIARYTVNDVNISDLGSFTSNNSSILTLASTTKGILLPRMTAGSKNSISDPAQGLQVYDISTATEGLWYYASGSIKAWTRVLNNTGSQEITGSLIVTQGITGSLQGTSSWAVSASWAPSAGGGTTLNGAGYVSMSGTTVGYVAAIPNKDLANSSITIQGSTTALGGSLDVINGTGFVKASGTSITYDNSTYYLASNPNGYTNNTGTVTSVTVSAGTGLSGGGTVTSTGTITLTNAAPDQTVVLNNGTGISVTGTYPNFTITNTVTDTNIYNSDGTLSANRTIDANGKFLKINNLNTLTLDGGATTNDIALFKGVEPNINISASGASNSAALFLSPSTGFNGAIHNRKGGGLEFYVGAGPSLATTIQSTGRINFTNYTTTTSFTGTVVGFLGFDASGNILTTTGSGATGGASLSGGKTNYNTIWNSTTTVSTGSVYQYSATQVQITGSSLAVGDIVPSATPGRIDASNDIVSYSTSDIRFKNNIKPINNALSKVKQISGVYFDWIEDIDHHGNKGHDIGVIAQELEQVLPEVVTTRDSGYKAVKYDKIVALLIQAVKEQQVEITELKSRIDGLTK